MRAILIGRHRTSWRQRDHEDIGQTQEMLVTVVEPGSFSTAAGRLMPRQPAVSKSIARIEEHLSVRLLLRSARGLAPTDAGCGSANTPVVLSTKRSEQRGPCVNRPRA
jgi:hypothetical protein